MKFLFPLLALSVLLSACGPSKQEILRQEILAQQRAEAARIEAQERADRAHARLEEARQHLSSSTTENISTQDTLHLLRNAETNKAYFFSIDLQAEKYNYNQKLQSFALVGLRTVDSSKTGNENFATLLTTLKTDKALELILAKEVEFNRLNQAVEKAGTQRIASLIPNIKTNQSLVIKNAAWQWNTGAFNDLNWQVDPEQAWELTSKHELKLQIGLRFCTHAPCLVTHDYQQHKTYSYQADVLSLLIYRADNKEVLAEFVSEQP